jgi:hypothetical protein
MLKPNEWYFLPAMGEGKFPQYGNKEVLGSLTKIIKVQDNTLYVDVESWFVTKDRKFIHNGVFHGMDSVLYSKYGKKVNAPPKAFEVLYSDTVNGIVDRCQETDDQGEYDE